jgi:hypothetical protein
MAPGSYNASIVFTNATNGNGNTTRAVSLTVNPTPTGQLTVTLGPAAAVTAGAQWNVDGGAWQDSGATLTGLSAGSHTVNYKTIPGWTSPASRQVTISGGQTATVTGTYIQQTGGLRVTISPAAAITAGAQWSIDGGVTWRASATTVNGLPVGPCTVTYKPVTGWTAPTPTSVTIISGQTTTTTGTYSQETGNLQVTISPAAAVTAGAQWSVDAGATWQASGATVNGLAVGVCTVTYKTVAGWTAPAAASVTINNGATTTATGTYTQQTGSLQVTISPAAAVTAGAQWNVDGGAWQNSAATVSGLAVGTHNVNFKAVSGWTAPTAASVSDQQRCNHHRHRHLHPADGQPPGDDQPRRRSHGRGTVERRRRRLAEQRGHRQRPDRRNSYRQLQGRLRLDSPNGRFGHHQQRCNHHRHRHLHPADGQPPVTISPARRSHGRGPVERRRRRLAEQRGHRQRPDCRIAHGQLQVGHRLDFTGGRSLGHYQ